MSNSNQCIIGNQSALCERFQQVPLSIEIVDFSPEWDYTNGGSKVLVCIRPPIEGVCENNSSSLEFERKFECSFGDTCVPVKFIQASVFKCKAPPHKIGFVNINLLYNGEPLDIGMS